MLSPYKAKECQKAGVIAFYNYIGRCYCHVAMYIATTNMQITVVKADVIALWKMLNPLVRALCVADVIARWRWNTTRVELADVIAKWQMEWPLCYFILFLVLECQTEPHPIYVADGTCPHFC